MASGSFELVKEVARTGTFERQGSTFRSWVEDREHARFPAEAGRYHVYVSRACPWSHRVILTRAIKRLEAVIGISYVHPFRDSRSWAFPGGDYVDRAEGSAFLADAYERTRPGYADRISVPVLWDTHERVIVNNESADIVRMLNGAFARWASPVDLYPEPLRPAIDAINEWVYRDINNGVYRAGFAAIQDAYDRAFDSLFASLDRAEALLATRRYLTGSSLTETDWRLWVTLVRFDRVYHTHFRCNGKRIADYPNLWGFTRELYQRRGVAETIAWDEILEHYYTTHDMLNPKRLIPRGPIALDFLAPHDRERLTSGYER
ncbi:MAG: glutathione S-transferase family protein [Solirubrobacteraceae bacterium]